MRAQKINSQPIYPEIYASGEQISALEMYGYCAVLISSKKVPENSLLIGRWYTLLVDKDAKKGRRIAVKLVAIQKQPNGDKVLIFVPRSFAYKPDQM